MKIQDYLHHYIGCSVLCEGRIYKLVGVEFDFAILWGDNGRYVAAAKEVKPILSPLSSMTENEAWDIIQHYPSPYNKIINPKSVRYYLSPVNEAHERCAPSLIYVVLPSVLAKGFDLFDLIPNGLAIDKTKQAIA